MQHETFASNITETERCIAEVGFAAAALAEFIKESTYSRVHASLVTLCSVAAAAAWFHELTRPTGMPNELNGSAC